MRTCLFLALSLALPALAQDITATPGGVATPPRTEPVVPGLIRRDRDTIALTLTPEKTLLLHDFDFNGEPIDTAKIHLRLLSPGVVELTSLAYTTGYWRLKVADAASFYGLGEHFDTLDHAHTIVRNVAIKNAGPKGSSTTKPIPFYLSTTGYGLWLDTTGEATFDLDASDREQVIVDFASNRLRLLLLTGPEANGRFPALLSQFQALSGPVTVPPSWAFAPWHTSGSVLHDGLRAEVDRIRALGLPASVLVMDSDVKQTTDDAETLQYLHTKGFKLVLAQSSWIAADTTPATSDKAETPSAKASAYAEAASAGFFVKTLHGTPWLGRWRNSDASLIDFTNARAKQWWQGQAREAITAGADGFQLDDAEGSLLAPGSSAADPVFADGTDPRMMRNRYATLFANAAEELIQKDLHGNGVLSARSVTTGANGLGFLKADDSEASFSPANGLPAVVTAGLSAGLSGLPVWTAGLAPPGLPDALLLARWIEFAAFTPVLVVDANTLAATPTLALYRRYAHLHMAMFPYRYAAALDAQRSGTPILRALVLDDQDDPHARAIKDEYRFGPDLLVAPLLDENTSRVVYLPAGEWLNLFTGEAFTGPRTLIAQAPSDTIPVYARCGTILPLIPDDMVTLVPSEQSGNKDLHTLDDRRLYELLGPAASTPTSMFDFEGRTLRRDGNTLTITGTKDARITIRWRFTTPHAATANGTPVQIQNDANGLPSVEIAYTGASLSLVWQ